MWDIGARCPPLTLQTFVLGLAQFNRAAVHVRPSPGSDYSRSATAVPSRGKRQICSMADTAVAHESLLRDGPENNPRWQATCRGRDGSAGQDTPSGTTPSTARREVDLSSWVETCRPQVMAYLKKSVSRRKFCLMVPEMQRS